MLEHEFEGDEQSLLNEKVTDEELHEILRQLGEFQFGGGEESRIRDIVEATGVDPKAIGRLLADIRKESFEKKYGLKINEHEVRIEHLEEKVEHPVPQFQPQHYDFSSEFASEDIEELQEIAEQRRKAKEMSQAMIPVMVVIGVLALFFIFILAVGKPNSQYDEPKTQIGVEQNGVHINGPVGGPYTVDDHGNKRPATKEETEAMVPYEAGYWGRKQREKP